MNFSLMLLNAVEGDEFVPEPVKFSNQSTIFDQPFGDFNPRTKKGLLLFQFDFLAD